MHNLHNGKIKIYANEHGIPHFHIEGPGFRCSIGIVSLELIVGSAPRKTMEEAIAWAKINQAALLQKWQELNPVIPRTRLE